MVGFILALPASSIASDVRTALDDAIRVFEVFGKHFAVGTSAAHATRELLSKANLVLPATAAVREMLAGTMDMVYSADSFQAVTGGPFTGGAETGLEGWPPGFYYHKRLLRT
ncbi:hypothetical protein C8A03DRAFT_37940 [Achaetomium macrosporum]|uniref:Uncharacterized protein n=1 Tax=Achaetomium macrosporum TaxID=79813 RepID=A0AAN7HAP5_9PEZI|nr:hypothetical protein C8A03DRAFT_37940 [Achaetomium macrosporum]